MRIRVVNLSIVVAFSLLVLGLFRLEIIQGPLYQELSRRNSIRLLPQPGARGRILDRNGKVIVDSALVYDVMLLRQDISQFERALLKTSSVLGVSVQDLRKTFKRGFTAAFIPVTVARNVSLAKAIALEELKMDFPGIVIQPRPLRNYPHGKIACHILGYLNEIDHWRLTKLADYGYKTKDIVGYTGIEEKYDYYLREEEGALSVEVDHRGRSTRILGFKPPQKGKDLKLTIDLDIQKIVEESLEGHKGSVVLMDPYTGEILAMASAPGFFPGDFAEGNQASLAALFNDADKPLINRAISSAYPPGSIFKLCVAAGGLEMNKAKLNTTYLCKGGMDVGKRFFKCWETHQRQDLIAAIAHSCDVFFYHTGLLMGPQAIHDYAVKFGYSKLTGIDVAYEVAGFVPDPLWKKMVRFEKWYDGDTANFSIGQGDLLSTPLQNARMTAVFLNKGFLVRPYLVKEVDGHDYTQTQKKWSRVPIKEKLYDYVRLGARQVVADPTGTAHILSTLEIEVAGKTGTAQVSSRISHGWFVGFFPYKKPRYVICTFLEHGGSGFSATLVTKQIIEKMLNGGLV